MLKRFLIIAALFLATFAFAAQAQLKPGSFGIGANFGGSNPYAMVHYALSDNMELGAGLGLSSVSYDYESDDEPDSESTLHFVAIGKYFLDRGRDVSPYIGASLNYSSYPGEEREYYENYSKSSFGLGAFFGGEVFLAKQFAVYAQIGLGYSMYNVSYETQSGDDHTNSRTTISLDGSSIGAVFFF